MQQGTVHEGELRPAGLRSLLIITSILTLLLIHFYSFNTYILLMSLRI